MWIKEKIFYENVHMNGPYFVWACILHHRCLIPYLWFVGYKTRASAGGRSKQGGTLLYSTVNTHIFTMVLFCNIMIAVGIGILLPPLTTGMPKRVGYKYSWQSCWRWANILQEQMGNAFQYLSQLDRSFSSHLRPRYKISFHIWFVVLYSFFHMSKKASLGFIEDALSMRVRPRYYDN